MGLCFSAFASTPSETFDADGFKQALKLKKEVYLGEGAFSGGDRLSSDFHISNIRMAANPAGYDRIVIDLGGNTLGEKSELSRSPFYLVSVNQNKKQVDVTLFGKAKVDFSTQSVIQAARKMKTIAELDFIPTVVEDRWIWSIKTQGAIKAEVFELTNPARIIIDLKK